MKRFPSRLTAGLSGLAILSALSMVAMSAPASAAGGMGSAVGTPGAGGGAAGGASAASAQCPWLNQGLPVQQRVNLLLPRMSLADKVSMATTTAPPSTSSATHAGDATSRPLPKTPT